MIKVGTPFDSKGVEGVKYRKEITDPESLEALRTIIDHLAEIDEPEDINKDVEIYFSLDRPKDSVTERQMYVWYQSDGRSILYNNPSDTYYSLPKKDTNKLKNILEQ